MLATPGALAIAQRRGDDMHEPTPTIDPAKLEAVERETLSRIQGLRHRMLTQLVNLELAVLHCCTLTRQGHHKEAKSQLSEATGLSYSLIESNKPIEALVNLLEGT